MNISQPVENLTLQSEPLFSICALYYLINSVNYKNWAENLDSTLLMIKKFCQENGLKGTILIAEEGINGTIAGNDENVKNFVKFLKIEFAIKKTSLVCKFNKCGFIPFSKMKVIKRNEIVSLRSDRDLDLSLKPENIDPLDWNNLLAQNNIQLIDTRNDYEVEIGKFKNAIDPNTRNFRDFKDFLHISLENNSLDKSAPTAIYCTGGIRCEKAGIYMKNIGFKHVYQLQGGILEYFAVTKNEEKNWIGDCFVFDDRVTVNDQLEPGQLRCIHCLNMITNNEDKKNITKGRVMCSQCNKD